MRKPAVAATRVYHAYIRAECEQHIKHTMHAWSYDDSSWLFGVIVKEWHDEQQLPCRVYRWRGPAPATKDPEVGDMNLDDLPY
jgi:hypothetical protein